MFLHWVDKRLKEIKVNEDFNINLLSSEKVNVKNLVINADRVN